VFGKVKVARIAYRPPGRANLHPADTVLNLPSERHSHGLRRLAVAEATRGSFDDAGAGRPAFPGGCGQLVGALWEAQCREPPQQRAGLIEGAE